MNDDAPEWLGDQIQQQVIAHDLGPLLYLGAPGTGTTTALAAAAARRTRQVGPGGVWVLTLGRPAATAMRAALAGFIKAGVLPTVTSPHGLALSIVRTYGRTDDRLGSERAVRLLSGAEEDLRIHELIRGTVEDRTVTWPAHLSEALPTLTFANEVRAFLTRYRAESAVGLGLSGFSIHAADRAAELRRALMEFAEIEAQTAALENSVDYAGLIELAERIASRDEVRERLHRQVRGVYVDEYHDFDLLQAQLLERIAGADIPFVVAANPVKQVLGFRGSDAQVVGDFLQRHSPYVIATQSHRGCALTHQVLRRVLPTPSIQGLAITDSRKIAQPQSVQSSPTTAMQVCRHESTGDLLAYLAHDVTAALLDDGVPWQNMAVIARGSGILMAAQRVLHSHGVPVHVLAEDMPLPDEPAVVHLLAATHAAVDPQSLTVAAAADLIAGPIGAGDPRESRELARRWRHALRQSTPQDPPPPFGQLQRDALVAVATGATPALPVEVRNLAGAQRLVALGELLAQAHQLLDSGPGVVMWQVWSESLPDTDGHPWPRRLERSARAGHTLSDHNLDAILALFATAQRLTERYNGVVGVENFLTAVAGQRIAAESIGARRGRLGRAVTLLTAHQARGQEWDRVFVLDAQEGRWPQSSLRRGLIDVEAIFHPELSSDSETASAQVVAGERRLFGLALSRARQRTSVYCVDAAESSGDQPSRFVEEMVAEGVEDQWREGRPARPRTLTGLIAALRSELIDPRASTEQIADAATQLAALAMLTDEHDTPMVELAHPDTWWHEHALTMSERPLNPVDQPVELSPSTLESISTCPLRWFLQTQAKAGQNSSTAAPIGRLVHALADAVQRNEIPPEPAALQAWLDRAWPALQIAVPWYSTAQRVQIYAALDRLCRYLRVQAAPEVFSERMIQVVIQLDQLAGLLDTGVQFSDAISMRGRLDRLERGADGSWNVIDFKTSKTKPTQAEVDAHLQLGLYQAAILSGALAAEGDPGLTTTGRTTDVPVVSGASLVQLTFDTGATDASPKVQAQAAITEQVDPSWLMDGIVDAVHTIRTEDISARPGKHCRSCSFTMMCPARIDPEVLTDDD